VLLETDSPRAFREQARALLTLTPRADASEPRVFEAGQRRIVVAESVNCPPGFVLRETLIVRGDFQCGPGSKFLGPVYAGGSAVVGKGAEVDALAADQSIVVSPRALVHRFADSHGWIDLRSGAWAGQVRSTLGIQLSFDAGARELFAPEVATQGRIQGIAESPDLGSYVELKPPVSRERPDLWSVRGYRPEKLSALGAETWVYDGSLHFPMPLVLRAKLVVRGSFSCPPGSLIEEDVKAGGNIRLGEGSICNGHLTSRNELTLEGDCLFEGNLKAGTLLRLAGGVRGFRRDGPVEVETGDRLILEPNVVVRGRLSAGSAVRSSQPEIEGGLELLLAGR